MKPVWRSARSRRRGSVVVALVAALIALQLLVTAIALSGSRDQDLTVRRVEAARAYYAAEAAANMSIREIVLDADEDGDGSAGTVFTDISPSPSIGIGGGHAGAEAVDSGGVTTLVASGTEGLASRAITVAVERSEETAGQAGLVAEMWTSSSPQITQLQSVNWNAAPAYFTVVSNVNLGTHSDGFRWMDGPMSPYALRLKGWISISTAGTWEFRLTSADGSDLWINGVRIVNNDGAHASQSRTGSVVLSVGSAAFECRMFENSGGSNLWLEWKGPGMTSYELVPGSAFTCAPTMTLPPIAANKEIKITGNSGPDQVRVDGFDSRNGAYGGNNVLTTGVPMSINSTNSGTWEVAGNSHVTVNGLVGPGGSPGSVIKVDSPATMVGTNGTLTAAVAMLGEGLPLTLPTTSSAYNSSSSTTITGNRRYPSFTASGSGVITISGAVRIIVNGDMTLSGSASIVLASGASLDLWVGGNLTLSSSARINNNGNPRSVRINMTSTSSTDVSLDGTAAVCAMVRSPFGRLAFMGNSNSTPHFYGTFHGDMISINQRGRIHADIGAFPTSGGTSSGASTTQITGWTQTQ